MTPIKCYPIKPYIQAQMWKPKKDRTEKRGSQREYAKHMGVHYNNVCRWCADGWIIDEYGQLYSPQRTTK